MRTFWDMKKFTYKDMPTLHELFGQADPLDLARAVLEAQGKEFSEDGDEKYSDSVSTVIRILGNIIATEPNAEASKAVVVPRECYREDTFEPRIDYSLEAEWITLPDVVKAEGVLTHTRRVLTCDEIAQLHKDAAGEDLHITSYSLSFTPWGDVLAAKVWLGIDWSSKVAYELMASVLWELTFNGPDAAATDEALDDLLEDFEAAKGGKSIPMELCAGFRPLGIEHPREERPYERAARVLNHNAEVDFLERVADLSQRLAAGGEWEKAE